MAGAPLYEAVVNALPPDAHHRRAWLALLRCYARIERELMQFIAQKYDSSLPRYDVLTALTMSEQGLDDYDRIITELLSGLSEPQLKTLTDTLERTIESVNEVAG